MERNDYDRVANQAEKALAGLVGNTHGPLLDTDSVTITKDGWINAVVKMQRTIDYCRGLAQAHWEEQVLDAKRGSSGATIGMITHS